MHLGTMLSCRRVAVEKHVRTETAWSLLETARSWLWNGMDMVVKQHGHGCGTAWSGLWNSMDMVVKQSRSATSTASFRTMEKANPAHNDKSSPTFLTTFMSESGVHTPVLKSAALSSKIKSERDGSPLNIPKLGTLSQRGGDLT